MHLCPELEISIPVGKDSMSMKMAWKNDAKEVKEVTAPLSLVVSAFAPVSDFTNTWTPTLVRPSSNSPAEDTTIFFVDLALGYRALGGSALAQVFGQVGSTCPDVRDTQLLKDFSDALQQLHESGVVLAYHDRSDGGLFTTLVEMSFAGRCGLEIMLDTFCPSTSTSDIMEALFNEELGAVFQVRKSDEINFIRCFATCGPPSGLIKKIGRVPPAPKQDITMYHGAMRVYRGNRVALQERWASTSYHLQHLRDNPACAEAEFASIANTSDPGLSYNLTYNPAANILPFRASLSRIFPSQKPRVAILREQGVVRILELLLALCVSSIKLRDIS